MTVPATTNAATGRQRADGRCPSGKSIGMAKKKSAVPGIQTHAPSHMAIGPPGTVPGAVMSAYVAYSSNTKARAHALR